MKAPLFVILAALLPYALAAPAQSEEMVQTPGGLRPKSNVIQIPEGGAISLTSTEIHLLDASQRIVHVAPRSEARVARATNSTGPPPELSGWISYAYWHRPSTPIENFVTTWVVPPNPTTDHGQLLYLFNGLQPQSEPAILQPVLQWGLSPAGGGSYWAVASWYVTDTTAFWSTPQQVAVGQSLQGIIQRTGQNADGTFNYVTEFANIPGVTNLTNSAELVWAFETLETYSVTTASDYPTGCTVFTDIDITTSSGAEAVSWSTTDDDADGIHATSGSNGDVSICYPLP
ncbi:hypothetical protein E1B28_005513 [Marasmius oreades]|uniref:Uncharacterized protein n=1 Tax=Marasmius oreades TaxID=181124 RepID=A0A9P7S3D8_9AGAR|nr:uncharacterized protein E1B28_005513 [Marasmius oreades]KAG7094694.1 hypothetical protein E1B28_005513 [Marasmius oreades]